MKNLGLYAIIGVVFLVSVAGYFAFVNHNKKLSEGALAAYGAKLAACKAYLNNSTQSVITTSRLTIYLPKDIYPTQSNLLVFKTASGTATAGWISNAGPVGQSYGATAGCWAYYYEFDGTGEVNLIATSSVAGIPDYLVHFAVSPNPMDVGQTITYANSQYGFTFTLPTSWQGYSIATTTWTGWATCPSGDCAAATGTEVLIRNPQWTEQNPWQDIPIMVFTANEWSAVTSGALVVSAAPFNPDKLGQNSRYVFALPARYNAALREGWQEVDMIMQSKPLYAF
ncbi:MAG: hypothetical protein M1361_01500 [Patescibacteria group bacterium]|nr:hypothetical protein [Patescibacteria group bacterium]MCL5224272.1 hypothetical protein [Patescibacteria group bacterium]